MERDSFSDAVETAIKKVIFVSYAEKNAPFSRVRPPLESALLLGFPRRTPALTHAQNGICTLI